MGAQVRLQEVMTQLSPTLRIYGRYTMLSALGVGGVGLAGRHTITIADLFHASGSDESVSSGAQKFCANEYYLRTFVAPVLEPFLEGMNEPIQMVIPVLVTGLFAYGAS